MQAIAKLEVMFAQPWFKAYLGHDSPWTKIDKSIKCDQDNDNSSQFTQELHDSQQGGIMQQ